MKELLTLAAFLVGLAFGLGIDVLNYFDQHPGLRTWLFDWQTLIGGLLALFAGAATAAVVIHQTRSSTHNTRQQLRAEAEAREESGRRKHLATRAVLPADLSEICNYALQCAVVICEVVHSIRVGKRSGEVVMPKLEYHVVKNLQNLIENISPSEAEIAAELLSVYQLLSARLSWLVMRYNGFDDGYIMNDSSGNYAASACIELHMRAESMFEFARRKVAVLSAPAFDDDTIDKCFEKLRLDAVYDNEFRRGMITSLQTAIAERVATHSPP